MDSRIIVALLLMFWLTISAALLTKDRSGSLDFVTGVETQMMMKSASPIFTGSSVKIKFVELIGFIELVGVSDSLLITLNALRFNW